MTKYCTRAGKVSVRVKLCQTQCFCVAVVKEQGRGCQRALKLPNENAPTLYGKVTRVQCRTSAEPQPHLQSFTETQVKRNDFHL